MSNLGVDSVMDRPFWRSDHRRSVKGYWLRNLHQSVICSRFHDWPPVERNRRVQRTSPEQLGRYCTGYLPDSWGYIEILADDRFAERQDDPWSQQHYVRSAVLMMHICFIVSYQCAVMCGAWALDIGSWQSPIFPLNRSSTVSPKRLPQYRGRRNPFDILPRRCRPCLNILCDMDSYSLMQSWTLIPSLPIIRALNLIAVRIWCFGMTNVCDMSYPPVLVPTTSWKTSCGFKILESSSCACSLTFLRSASRIKSDERPLTPPPSFK